MSNRLADETSPYLLQHADNPVDWRAWGPDALREARDRDRPILLSIGYSACHWCHVMAHESFEDEDTAAVMNRLFVNIKVDREERPDVDQIYMRAVQAMTGGGGWPLTVFLTPDAVPYYGGTYFPPEARRGTPAFRQVLLAASNAYHADGEDVRKAGRQLLAALKRASAGPEPEDESADQGSGSGEGSAVTTELLDGAVEALSRRYDPSFGGFGQAPKFPQPALLELLLRHHIRTADADSLEMAVHTLRRMAAGGIRDHLGGGFHRYSVDGRWLVPHFEKMLYDNALLGRAYLDAWRVTGADDLRAVAEETLAYMTGDLQAPGGGFYAARDADSDGEEGVFYVWTVEEVDDVLGDEAPLFRRTYDVVAGGNFEGRSILHLPQEPAAVARREGLEPEDLEARLARARAQLLDARERRTPPQRDEKILTGWNGLAIRTLAEAGAALGSRPWVEAAVRAASFVQASLWTDQGLLHVWTAGEARIPAFLEDHAALANALLSLHEATLDPRWLESVHRLCEAMLDGFWTEDDGLFHDTHREAPALIVRPRDAMDMATPSGNSLAAEALWRAGRVLDRTRYTQVARRVVAREAAAMAEHPAAYGRLLSVADRLLAPPVEVALVGRRGDEALRALQRAAAGPFLRDRVLAGRQEGEELFAPIPLLDGRGTVDGRAAAWVCRDYTCDAPVTRPDAVREALRS